MDGINRDWTKNAFYKLWSIQTTVLELEKSESFGWESKSIIFVSARELCEV